MSRLEDVQRWGQTLEPVKSYAGVGARSTPRWALKMMRAIARKMSGLEYELRSGGADGADTAFEQGCTGRKSIFLPWEGYRNRRYGIAPPFDHNAAGLAEFVWNLHAAKVGVMPWDGLKDATRAFMTRNSMQVVDFASDQKVCRLVCYTEDGCTGWKERAKDTGGTGQAIAVADILGVPVTNLGLEDHRDKMDKWLEANED